MGFDKDQPGPVVQPQKKTTQVNIWIVVAVLVFLILGLIGTLWVHSHSRQVTHDENVKMQQAQQAEPPEKQQRQQ